MCEALSGISKDKVKNVKIPVGFQISIPSTTPFCFTVCFLELPISIFKKGTYFL